MNIGIFTDTYEPQINGVVTSIKASVDYLNKQHKVYIFCPNVKPKLKSTETVWRFKSVVYPFLSEYRLALPYNKKLQKIKALNLDLIHIHTPFNMGCIGLRMAKKLKIPAIHTYHTYFEKYIHYVPFLPEKWVSKYAKKESQRFCNRCQLIIAPSEEMKLKLEGYKIDPPITILSSGINPYHPTESDKDKVMNKYQLKNKTVCSFIGRLGVEKNIYFLIDAFEKIHQALPDTHLIIVGDGPERSNLEDYIAKKGLTSATTLTGYLSKSDVFTVLHLSTVMLFPSVSETQGLTVVESLICGTPVVGINKMGVKDVIQGSGSGILTNDNLDDYITASIDLLTNKQTLLTCIKNTKKRGEDFLSETINQQLEALYIQVKKGI